MPTSFVTNAGVAVPAANILNVLGSTVPAGSTPFSSIGAGNTVTYQTQISQAIAATDSTKIGLAAFNSAQFTVDANGFVSSLGSTTDLHVARYIVSAGGTADGANYTTITSAITAAALAGGSQTVFIQPGTYTENLTMVPKVNLAAFVCDAQNQTVTIKGKLTATAAGLYSISGINLETNGDYVLQITGANALTVILNNCYITATNANAINCTNSSAGVQLYRSFGSVGANTYFVFTGGGMDAYYSVLAASSTTASTFANSSCNFYHTSMYCPVTTSGTGAFSGQNSFFAISNTTNLTIGGSGSSFLFFSRIEAGTGSAISIGAGATLPVVSCSVYSTNANAITGAGTIQYALIAFYGAGSSSTVNTTTKTPLATLI